VYRSAALEQDVEGLAGNCAHIVGGIRDHRMLSHYLSAAPYAGAFGRLRGYLADSAAARGRPDARHVLDALVTAHRAHEAYD
jgi:hypothetical protein